MAKIILSRKGFDSSAGGYPSPILGHSLLSLPIPQPLTSVSYRQLLTNQGNSVLEIMAELGIRQPETCHLDPDLVYGSLTNRPVDWQPAFGQTGAALSHLQGEGVGEGDLFLFFGWFKQAETYQGKWRFVPHAPDLHVIYGYLEVGKVIDISKDPLPNWANQHVHVACRSQFTRGGNVLFVAKEQSTWLPDNKGAGIFSIHPHLILTDPQRNPIRRTHWRLPSCFFAADKACRLSYHRHKYGVNSDNDSYQMKAASRGQEFVSDLTPEVAQWVQELATYLE